MSWNNDHIPEIVYDYDDESMRKTLAVLAATLDKNHFGNAGNHLRHMAARASINGERAVNKTANQTVKEVGDLMKERQYRQPSYHPGTYAYEHKANNQRLVHRLSDHVDGNKHTIYSDVTNKGYNYSQAFEFGLLTRNYPAHHPFQDAGTHLRGVLEKNVDEGIRKGFED